MCYLNYPWDSYLIDSPDPTLQPFPRLAWAVPVEVTTVGANLEAYSNIDQQITTLRLSHRFGSVALSTIPQEILEMIVDEAQRIERQQTLPFWKKTFACFQGLCTAVQHLEEEEEYVDEVWSELFTDQWDEEDNLNRDDYDTDERADMIEDFLNDSHDDMVWELHQEFRSNWLDLVCLCKKNRKVPEPHRSFSALNEILRSRFGLEIVILHEIMSSTMNDFLPRPNFRDDFSHYTSAFLTLASGTFSTYGVDQPKFRSSERIFAPERNHLAFRQAIDPSKLALSDGQRQRFARGMAALGLSPHYHLTELEKLISSPSNDELLWEICRTQLPGWPKVTSTSCDEKQKKIKQYLENMNKELSKQSWPQLQLLAASDAVSPSA
ncbi:hypothetical protein K458DRAFT_386908 [Lentithecium fluviatile CBS 122367]|uniref:Uncharacterized protein n=1 Tax=Lentithecium fluviatile CBS 122367 TaxID=1168545 RepID=A0A6G1J8Q8_9PLEO|nr:hypothetical protein K458DRAFT_386908 [Lentithecium fluviatile CBS 122367]